MEALINRSVFDRVVHAVDQTIFTRDCVITMNTRLADDLKLRRIGRVKLGMCLEETFKFDLTDDVLEQAATVGCLVNYLSRRYYRDADIDCRDDAAAEVTPTERGVFVCLRDWVRV